MITKDKELREVFHFLFLEQLLRKSSKEFYVLKGGVNLRFFFNSPRYSEDMDLDVLGGSVSTLKKNGYQILENDQFRRVLAVYGIQDIKVNDPQKAKQTSTTQRFRFRLVNEAGEEFPTTVEFSRRNKGKNYLDEEIDPSISQYYKKLSFSCQHYEGKEAVFQKITALAQRSQTQARDIFDLYILFLGGFFKKNEVLIESSVVKKAEENLMAVSFEQYRDQVVEYLDESSQSEWNHLEKWKQIQDRIIKEMP